MPKEIQLKNDKELKITLDDGTTISISQDSNLQVNLINIHHHKTRVVNEITLDKYGYDSFKENETLLASWTECRSELTDSNTLNKTVVNHVAFNEN